MGTASAGTDRQSPTRRDKAPSDVGAAAREVARKALDVLNGRAPWPP